LLKILAAERPVCLSLRLDDGQFLQLLAGAVGVIMAVVGFGFVIVNHGATKDQCEGIGTGLGWASGAARGGSGNYVGGVAKAACNPTGGDVDLNNEWCDQAADAVTG
jgi:hypothetical protein